MAIRFDVAGGCMRDILLGGCLSASAYMERRQVPDPRGGIGFACLLAYKACMQ